jgi:hypothetical protein
MGHAHLTTSDGALASGGRLGWRSCLRKGCSRTFQARRYNQRYCQDPECIREVRRWQGAKRQRKCRSQAEGRQRHAEAERQRRKQRASAVSTPPQNESVAGDVPAENGAWSHSRRHPAILCDRPGCYEPPRDSPRAPAAYCGDDCRGAMHQARDRERKWLRRKTEAGRFKRRLEYQAARAKRRQDRVTSDGMTAGRTSTQPDMKAGHSRGSVLFYRRDGDGAVDSRAPTEVIAHDSQRTPDSRPRPPPTS